MQEENVDAADRRPSDLIAAAGDAERQLLRDEERAERQLTKATAQRERARTKLEQAQARYDVRQAAVEDAEAALRERQAARAAGPNHGELAPPSTAGERPAPPKSDAPARARRRTTAQKAAKPPADSKPSNSG